MLPFSFGTVKRLKYIVKALKLLFCWNIGSKNLLEQQHKQVGQLEAGSETWKSTFLHKHWDAFWPGVCKGKQTLPTFKSKQVFLHVKVDLSLDLGELGAQSLQLNWAPGWVWTWKLKPGSSKRNSSWPQKPKNAFTVCGWGFLCWNEWVLLQAYPRNQQNNVLY